MNKILDRFLADRDLDSLVGLWSAGLLAGYWTLNYAWHRYWRAKPSHWSFNGIPLKAGALESVGRNRFTSEDLFHVCGCCAFDSAACLEEDLEGAQAECMVEKSKRVTYPTPRDSKKPSKIKSTNL